MMVYDSLYDSIDDRTQVVIHELFGVSKHDVAKVHKQQGVQDCGVFVITFATTICCESRVEYGTEWHIKIYSSSDVLNSTDNYVGEHFPPQQDMFSHRQHTTVTRSIEA